MGKSQEENPDSAGRRRRGPAKDQAKHAAILDAARELFARGGYEAISMDAVAALAHVTKRTLYNHFGSKDQLFEAAIHQEGERLRSPAIGSMSSDQDLRLGLCAVGVPLLTMLSSPQAHEFARMLIGQIDRHAELIEKFYSAGPAGTLRELASLLRKADRKGHAKIADAELAADQLMSMWLGQHHFRQQLGLVPGRTRDEIEAHVRACVEMFLKAYAPEAGS